MAITRSIPNEFLFESGKSAIDFSNDDFKVILMASGFTFNPDTHGTYSDVSASEIDNSGGYTVGGYALVESSAWAQNNTDNTAEIAWADHTFTASGAAFDAFCAAIIYDDTHASDVIVACIALGQDISLADGSSFQLQDLGFKKSLKAA